jgi:large-conductance mechanosensitive channel
MINWEILISTIINWIFFLAIGFTLYRFIKKMAKTWIKESIKEYDKDKREQDAFHRVDSVRNKYS